MHQAWNCTKCFSMKHFAEVWGQPRLKLLNFQNFKAILKLPQTIYIPPIAIPTAGMQTCEGKPYT